MHTYLQPNPRHQCDLTRRYLCTFGSVWNYLLKPTCWRCSHRELPRPDVLCERPIKHDASGITGQFNIVIISVVTTLVTYLVCGHTAAELERENECRSNSRCIVSKKIRNISDQLSSSALEAPSGLRSAPCQHLCLTLIEDVWR